MTSAAARRRSHPGPGRPAPLRCRGADEKKALVTVGRSILTIVWNLLADEHATFVDLAPDHYDTHAGIQRAIRNHVRALHALGYQVTLSSVA